MKFLLYVAAIIGLASGACFDNGDKEIQGMCFKLVPQMLTYQDARDWCHYKNPVTSSNLAYVPNQFTANFLASYARSAFGSNDGYFWIGLSRTSSNSPFTWDNGQPLGYTNFGTQLGQNYIAESIVNTKWNAFGASDKNFFVCSYDPAAPPTFSPLPTRMPETTMMPMPTTTGDRNVATTTRVTTGRPTVGPWQICPNQQTVFKGQVGVIYEMLPASTQQNAINAFVENVLLNSNFYGLALDILTHDNRTLVTAIPYPTTDKYNVQGYGSARSVDEFRNQVIAFNGMIQPISQSSSISDALLYVTTSLPAGGVKSSLIIVGNSAAMIDNIAPILTNQLRSDFDIYTVGVGSGAVDLSPLSSGTGFSFTGDTQQVADQIGLKMASSSPSVYCPPPVTTVRPTVGPCQCTGRWVYNGDLAIAFENIKTNGSQSVANFLSNTLLKNPDSYGLTNDVNGNQPSQLTLIPYPDSNTYPTYPYGWIRSVNDIGNYIDAISPLPLATPDPRISDALTFISAQPTTLNSKVVLLVGSNGTNVNAAMDSANQLKNAGYLVITVAQTTAASVFQPLASGSQFALHIGDGNDDAVAAQIASMLLDYSFTCFDDGSSTPSPTTRCPGTQGTTQPGFSTTTSLSPSTSSSSPFNGKIATVFELNAVQPEIQNIIHFVRNNLYNSTNYDFATVSEAINIPYAFTDNYNSNILQYGIAKSLIDLQSNVDTLYINAFSMRDATISDGLVWLINNYPYGINTIIIVVGYHDDENPATTTFILETLRAQGYKVITVAAGVGHGDLSGIADKPEWYFQVNDSNGQTIADAISEVLCSLQFL